MNYKKEVEEIDVIISHLRTLKREYISAEKKSEKALNSRVDGSRQTGKAYTNLDRAMISLDKQRKTVWKAIKGSSLEVSLDECEYYLGSSHVIK